MKRSAELRCKEPYATPKLTIYGTIEQLTKAVNIRGTPDGGSSPPIRTSV
jgi:hypothetical protein